MKTESPTEGSFQYGGSGGRWTGKYWYGGASIRVRQRGCSYAPHRHFRLYMRISSFGKLALGRQNMDEVRLCCAFLISENVRCFRVVFFEHRLCILNRCLIKLPVVITAVKFTLWIRTNVKIQLKSRNLISKLFLFRITEFVTNFNGPIAKWKNSTTLLLNPSGIYLRPKHFCKFSLTKFPMQTCKRNKREVVDSLLSSQGENNFNDPLGAFRSTNTIRVTATTSHKVQRS